MTCTLKQRNRAVARGIRFITGLVSYPHAAAYFGSGLLWFSRALVLSGASNLRRTAIELARFGLDSIETDPSSALCDDPQSIAEHVRLYGAAEAAGVRRPRIKATLRRMAQRHGATDFFGFDPTACAPPDDLPHVCSCGRANVVGRRRCATSACRAHLVPMSRHRAWSIALTTAFCGDQYGVPLGAGYRQVLQWLPAMRPYVDPMGSVSTNVADVAYAVTHVVYTLCDYGRYGLSASWLPWEYAFLRSHVDVALSIDDPDVVGELTDSLRAFGVGDRDPQVQQAFEYLLSTQNADGSWGVWDADSVYTGFHATWAAIDGLREFCRDGERVSFPAMLPLLVRWARPYTSRSRVPMPANG
jgi:hypothetical protein